MSQLPPIQPSSYYTPPAGGVPRSSGLAMASMICGIVSLALFCVWHLALPCAIVAIVLGAVAKGKIRRGEAGGNGMATAGIVCGSIALLLSLLIVAGVAALFYTFKSPATQNWIQHLQQQQMQYFKQLQLPTTTTAPAP